MKCGGNITHRQSNRGSNRDSWKNLTQPGLGRGGGADAVLPPERVGGQQNKARPVPAQYVDAPVPFTALKHHWREETGIQEQQLAGMVASQQRKMTATPAVYEYENGGPSAVVKARQAIVTTLAAPAMPGAATQASPARVRFSPQATPPLHWTCMRSMAASPTLQPAPMPLVQQSVAVAQQHAWLRQQEALANFVPVDADLTMPPSSQQLLAVQQQQERAAAEAYSRHFYQAQLYQQQQQQRYVEQQQQRRVLSQPLYNPMLIPPPVEAGAEMGQVRGSCESNLSKSGSCGSCGDSSDSNPARLPSANPDPLALESLNVDEKRRKHAEEGEGEIVAQCSSGGEVEPPCKATLPGHNHHLCSAGAAQSGEQQEWIGVMGEGEGEVDEADHAGSCGGESSGGKPFCQRGSQTAKAYGPTASGSHRNGRRGPDGSPARRVARLQSDCLSTSGTWAGKMAGVEIEEEEVEMLDSATLATTPIFGLSEDLLVSILQMLSTSEWRTVVPCVCKRWKAAVETCEDMWESVEVCPFENSAVARRLRSRPERFWAMDGREDHWLASSSLSKAKILRGLGPHMPHIHTLLLSCLALNLTPASYDGHPIASGEARRAEAPGAATGRPVRIRSTDMTATDLIWMLGQMRTGLRQLVLRVSGEITTSDVIREVCRSDSLELLHADLGNVELDCAMLAPLKQLRSLRLKRDELSLDINEGSIKLVNLHRLGECSKLTRLSLGFDTHLEALPPALFNLDKLTMLEVDRCSGMQSLPPAIANLTSLQTLSLTGSSSLGALPPEIKSLAQLVSLNLSFCTQMSALPAEIGHLSNLQHMNMEGGYAIFDDSVPSEIGLCCSLQSLVLSDTHILSLPRLAVKLAACRNLQILALDHNDDLQVEEYPKEIMALPKLTTLSMRKYERQSWSVLSTRNISRMQEGATQLRISGKRNLNIIL